MNKVKKFKTFNELLNELKDKNIYLLIGHGSKNQFKNLTELKKNYNTYIKFNK